MPRNAPTPSRKKPNEPNRSYRQPDHPLPTPWYTHPAWYDVIHATGTARDLRIIQRLARLHLPGPPARRKRWLEPACGTARLLRLAARRGHTVAGFDIAPQMIHYARARFARSGTPARLWTDDLRTFRAPAPADLALCPINSLRHLPSDRDVLQHLRRVRAALRPGGVYLLGVGVENKPRTAPLTDRWSSARGPLRLTQSFTYHPPRRRVERVDTTLHVATPTRRQRFRWSYPLRSWTAPQWLELLHRAPLRLEALHDEDATPADPHHIPPQGIEGWWILRRA